MDGKADPQNTQSDRETADLGADGFLIINGIVTLIAVFRWSQRVDLIDPSNSFWAFVDARFPNERMERIFANMEFGSIK